jgi:hypothetical protein
MNEIINCLIKNKQDCEIFEEALRAILINTLLRDFEGDIMYKSGVLHNIRVALGDEKYNYYVDLYS